MAAKKENSSGFKELKAAIKAKAPGRLYVFHGEETFLLHHYLGLLKKLLTDELTEAFNYHRMNSETFSVLDFADGVENLPMMAETTMVLVEDIDFFKLPEGDREKIAQILSDIPDYCTVVLTYETVAWKPDKRFKALWDAIQKNASIVSFDKQDQRDLIAWVTRHFAAEKKSISADLCAYLIDITGGTMTALSSEIRKICAYSEADVIKRADIDAVTEPVMDAVVFRMTELLSQGAYGPALQSLQTLLKMQQEPIAILGAIGGHFRRIASARILMDNGKTASDLAKLYGIMEYAARKTMESARRFRPEFCAKAAELVLETDRQMKTSFDEPERLLEMLILRLAQEAKRD